MNLKEAMSERHTVRKFLDKDIPDDVKEQLNGLIDSLNEKYDLSMEIKYNDESAFNAALK